MNKKKGTRRETGDGRRETGDGRRERGEGRGERGEGERGRGERGEGKGERGRGRGIGNRGAETERHTSLSSILARIFLVKSITTLKAFLASGSSFKSFAVLPLLSACVVLAPRSIRKVAQSE